MYLQYLQRVILEVVGDSMELIQGYLVKQWKVFGVPVSLPLI